MMPSTRKRPRLEPSLASFQLGSEEEDMELLSQFVGEITGSHDMFDTCEPILSSDDAPKNSAAPTSAPTMYKKPCPAYKIISVLDLVTCFVDHKDAQNRSLYDRLAHASSVWPSLVRYCENNRPATSIVESVGSQFTITDLQQWSRRSKTPAIQQAIRLWHLYAWTPMSAASRHGLNMHAARMAALFEHLHFGMTAAIVNELNAGSTLVDVREKCTDFAAKCLGRLVGNRGITTKTDSASVTHAVHWIVSPQSSNGVQLIQLMWRNLVRTNNQVATIYIDQDFLQTCSSAQGMCDKLERIVVSHLTRGLEQFHRDAFGASATDAADILTVYNVTPVIIADIDRALDFYCKKHTKHESDQIQALIGRRLEQLLNHQACFGGGERDRAFGIVYLSCTSKASFQLRSLITKFTSVGSAHDTLRETLRDQRIIALLETTASNTQHAMQSVINETCLLSLRETLSSGDCDVLLNPAGNYAALRQHAEQVGSRHVLSAPAPSCTNLLVEWCGASSPWLVKLMKKLTKFQLRYMVEGVEDARYASWLVSLFEPLDDVRVPPRSFRQWLKFANSVACKLCCDPAPTAALKHHHPDTSASSSQLDGDELVAVEAHNLIGACMYPHAYQMSTQGHALLFKYAVDQFGLASLLSQLKLNARCIPGGLTSGDASIKALKAFAECHKYADKAPSVSCHKITSFHDTVIQLCARLEAITKSVRLGYKAAAYDLDACVHASAAVIWMASYQCGEAHIRKHAGSFISWKPKD